MSNDVKIELLGVKELNKILDTLPSKTRRSFILKAWRRSAKPLIRAAKNNIRSYSKSLANSIGNITGRSRDFPTIYVGPRARGKHKDIAWIAPFVEFGTSGTKRKRAQGYKRKTDNPDFAWVSKIKPGGRYRADQKAQPFMRPAVSSTINQVQHHFYKELKVVFEKHVQKYNKVRGL